MSALAGARGPRGALAFLTPIGGASPPTPGALAWFPVVGAAIGGALGLLWWATDKAWPAAVAAALVVAGDLVLTGMLHVDGLVDSADGLLPPRTAEKRLAIMRSPDVGAFGIAAAGVVLLLRWVAVDAIAPSVVLLVGVYAASRTVMATAAVVVPYARAQDGGLATAFVGRGAAVPGVVAAVVGTAVAVTCVLLWHPVAGAVSLAAGVAAAGAVLWLAVRRVGGYTGDVLGAAGVVLETVALVTAAARW